MLYIGCNNIGHIKDTPSRIIELIDYVDYVIVEFENEFLEQINQLKLSLPNYLVYEHSDIFFDKVINLLKNNKNILIINEYGCLGVADPGYNIVDLAIKNNLEISVIPGPSIGPVAISASGFHSIAHIVIEVFEKTEEEKNKKFSELKDLNYPIVILDHKEQLKNNINLLQNLFFNREICLCINLGMEENEKIIKGDIDNILNIIKEKTDEELFGPLNKKPVISIVVGS